MFFVENDAAEYIRTTGNVVVIDLKYEPSVGDGWLTSRKFLGCYHPVMRIGIREGWADNYKNASVKGITIYYPPELNVKAGQDKIKITLCQILCWRWLELEGASISPVFGEMMRNA